MCWTLFIATDTPQPIGEYIPDVTKLYLTTPSEDEIERLVPLFTKPYIYNVGSDVSCGCGFHFYPPSAANLEWYNDEDYAYLAIQKQSPEALIQFLNEHTQHQSIELFSKWEGWDTFFVKDKQIIDIRTISMDVNYFNMEDQQFIVFTQQNT